MRRLEPRAGKPWTRRSGNPARRESGGRPVEQFLGPGFEIEPRVLVRLVPRDRGDALDEVEHGLGLAAFLASTVSMILAVSALPNPRFLRNSVRSSSVARDDTLASLAMPLMNGCGEELAKRVSAGAASCVKREAAYFEWRMAISSKSSTPQRLRFWQTARR